MTGVPAGAVLISLSELEQRAPDELTLDMPVYVICSSSNCSRNGAETGRHPRIARVRAGAV